MWACPICLSRLYRSGESLNCTQHHPFPIRHGLPTLLRPEDEGLLADAESYASSWRRSPWSPPPGDLRDLPYRTRGRARSFWEPKARSLEALLRLLGPASGRIVVDAGAGTGWLSHHLTRAGFRCFATDLSGDPVVGLGAAKAFDGEAHAFERAVASLTRWPFRDEAADVAVCNASLHYLREIAPALREAHRVLRPGGALFILNSPVHRDPGSASKAAKGFRDTLRALGAHGALVDGHRHFIVEDLERELRSVYSAVRRHEAAVGMRFRLVRLLKRIALRTELASFPIYEARRGKS